jgi:Baseplate J-like protein
MTCVGTTNCNCGCCSGTSVQTPQQISNLPGLSSVSYRAGTWATFKESMLARLSCSDYPALSALKTRSDDDFTIAFLDATAVVLDILTFYQERLANESYLRVATQLRSLTELSRLIGYTPAPAVSASVYLAFTLKAAPGLPATLSTAPITIPAGTKVQSVPAQGQTPQTFETSSDIAAKPDWNALPVQSDLPWIPPGANGVYLAGTTTQLQPGDSLLILGVSREEATPGSTANEQWDVVIANKVQVDAFRKLTYVAWDRRINHSSGDGTSSPAPWVAAKLFAFRQKAALFGHNALSPNLFVNLNATVALEAIRRPADRNALAMEVTREPLIAAEQELSVSSLPDLVDSTLPLWIWNDFNLLESSAIDLDATYSKIVVGSWFALVSSAQGIERDFTTSGPVLAQLYKVQSTRVRSKSSFGLSAKVTELQADYIEDISSSFPLQYTDVWAQSDQLQVAPQPLTYPLYGTVLDLQGLRPDLVGVKAVALTGKSQKIAVVDGVTSLWFIPDDPTMATQALNLKPGDVLTVNDPSPLPVNPDGSVPDWSTLTGPIQLNAQDASGRTGTVQAGLNNFTLVPSASGDPVLQEYALVSSVMSVTQPYPHTLIQLQSNLQNCYDRTSTTVNANVVLATHGQSVSEIMGSGSASTPNQSFTLKQSALTFVQAPTPTGRQSTLQVQANGMQWAEVPSLFEQDASKHVFSTLNQADGTTDVLFGDNVEGSTLPTGQSNVHANYRIGSGASGNVPPGAITTLIDRPLGVSGVVNPESAAGGQDAQSIDDIRSNAPQTVLTLGRAVSITDYQNYASTFAGIAKAHAIWIPSGPGRGVFLTVAGVGGSALPPESPTLANLAASLWNFGNPLAPIRLQTYAETLFGLTANVQYDPAYVQSAVQAQVLQALSDGFSFDARTFGQAVGIDEVTQVIQSVPGVIAANVTGLTRGVSSTGGSLISMSTYATLLRFNKWNAGRIIYRRPIIDSSARLCAFLPVGDPKSLPQPAEILVLDPTKIVLGVMS